MVPPQENLDGPPVRTNRPTSNSLSRILRPFVKPGQPLPDLKQWGMYVIFIVFVIGAPAFALFLKRGWGATYQDGEAFLFSGALIIAVLFDIIRELNLWTVSGLRDAYQKLQKWDDETGILSVNLALLGISAYYVVTSNDLGLHLDPHTSQLVQVKAYWVRVLLFWGSLGGAAWLAGVRLAPKFFEQPGGSVAQPTDPTPGRREGVGTPSDASPSQIA